MGAVLRRGLTVGTATTVLPTAGFPRATCAQEYLRFTVTGNVADAPRLLLTVTVPGFVSLVLRVTVGVRV